MAKVKKPLKLRDKGKKILKDRMAKLKKDYSYGENYPTVAEAKQLIKDYYTKRGFPPKSVQNLKDRGFSVKFKAKKATETLWYVSGEQFNGPYGLERVRLSWNTVKFLKDKK